MHDLTVQQAKRFGVICCDPETTLINAAEKMPSEDISSLVVVNDQGHLEGILTRTDLLRAGLEREDWLEQPVGRYMTRQVVTVIPQDHLIKVVKLLIEKNIHRVVVVHKDADKLRPLGVLSDADLVYNMTREI